MRPQTPPPQVLANPPLARERNPFEYARDVEISALLRRRDPAGLEQLLQVHAGRVRARLRDDFAGRLDADGIDDLILQASLNVWQGRAMLYDPEQGSLGAYFLGICRNIARRRMRSDRELGLSFRSDLDRHASRTEAGRPLTEPDQLLVELHLCIRRLPRLQRLVMLADLAAADGLAQADELARTHDTTRDAIYASRSQALRTLRAALRHLLGRSAAAAAPAKKTAV